MPVVCIQYRPYGSKTGWLIDSFVLSRLTDTAVDTGRHIGDIADKLPPVVRLQDLPVLF